MKKILAAVYLMVCAAVPVYGQIEPQDSTEIESMDEILISAQRLGEKRRNTSRQIEVITADGIGLAQQPTMGDVLGQTGQVFVQKSQLGGGSPVLRGFEASRVLMVMDGIRMNNATYRAGHLQDIVTIDPFMLDRTEIYFGSGSALYGSDALGGVIYLKTKSPEFTEKSAFRPTALVRYASAGKNLTANAGWSLSSKKTGWIFNYTYNSFGDPKMGSGRMYTGDSAFGLRYHYVSRINGRDSILKNPDPYVQKGAGYDQHDVMTKVSFRYKRWISTVNLQASLAGVVPRYDRLNLYRNGKLRFAEWDYTPQNRYLAAYTAEIKPSEKWSHRFIVSVQRTEVGRASRALNNPIRLTQTDKVNMFAFNYDQVYQPVKNLKVQSGFEWVLNDVNSVAATYNINTGNEAVSKETRYADSIAKTQSMSVFSNATFEIIPNDLTVNAGLRLSYYTADAVFSKNNFWGLDYGSARVRNFAPVFNVGVVKNITRRLLASANLSTGYRNPNIDDLTKLFESIPGEKYIIPNTGLKAESTRTADICLRYSFAGRMSAEAGVYHTTISNLLIDRPATLNGSDSVNYMGEMTRVYQMKNAASGFVRGAYLGFKIQVIKHWYTDFYYASTFGRYRIQEGAGLQPLDHVAPDHGRAGLRYARKNIQAEAFMLFNGYKKASEYSPSGEDNASQAPGGRTPSWQTYNIRGSWVYNKKLTLTLAAENLLDLNYRVFSSGITAPGRNIIASVRIAI